MSLANKISLFRLFLVPIFTYYLIRESYLFSAVLVAICSFSDLLDGYVARKYGQVTKLGIILDPLADKTLISIAVIYFTVKGYLPLWFLLGLFYRDCSLVLGMLALHFYKKESIVSSKMIGKVSAGLNLVLIFLLCVVQEFAFVYPAVRIVFVFSAVSLVLSFVGYSFRWFQLFEDTYS